MSNKIIYKLSDTITGLTEEKIRLMLGNKGYNLWKIYKSGVNVPKAFIINSESCNALLKQDITMDTISSHVKDGLQYLKEDVIHANNFPTIVSVRSGAAVSMPGMMNTILNIGVNDDNIKDIYQYNESFALDLYKRMIYYFSTNVFHIKNLRTIQKLFSTPAEKMSFNVIDDLKEEIYKQTQQTIPQDIHDQIRMSTEAVINSWNSERAILYRKINNIDNTIGTAVIIQNMVFGNINDKSATGVVFSRDPSTGADAITGEYMYNAQGEDIVSGTVTPKKITKDFKYYADIYKISKQLESIYKKVQDIEFTIENSKLYILQTRAAQMNPMANIHSSVDMVHEGIIDKIAAINNIKGADIMHAMHPNTEINEQQQLIGVGIGASPGCISGVAAFSSEEVLEMCKDNNVILCRQTTSPEDINGIYAANGVLTMHGGLTSHAAVVTRGMGKICVVGAEAIMINNDQKTMVGNNITVQSGDTITINGKTGEVFSGAGNVINDNKDSCHYKEIVDWAKEICDANDVKICVNADNDQEYSVASNFGVREVGLSRTEHMFLSQDRVEYIRKIIILNYLNKGRTPEYNNCIKKLKELQIESITKLYKSAQSSVVKVRLLDAPLHEFLPPKEEHIKLCGLLGISKSDAERSFLVLHESNPMLGFRGVRLGIIFNDIYIMQIRSIFTVVSVMRKLYNLRIVPHILVPLVACYKEFEYVKNIVHDIASNEFENCEYKLGIMLELPCMLLNPITQDKGVDFYSIGSNDLTQTTLGISRDDAGLFVHQYIDAGILDFDPFERIADEVLDLIKSCLQKLKDSSVDGKSVDITVCGEQAGNISSICKFLEIGIKKLSCSAYKVPIALLETAKYIISKS